MEGYDLGVQSLPLGLTGFRARPNFRLATARGHLGGKVPQESPPPTRAIDIEVAARQTAEAVDAAWAALEVVGKTLTGRANAWMDPAARPRREVTTLASPAQVAARAKAKAKRAARRAGVIPLNYGGPVHFL